MVPEQGKSLQITYMFCELQVNTYCHAHCILSSFNLEPDV